MKKCNESWEMVKIMEYKWGQNNVRAEKAVTKWVIYEDLFCELFKERPYYEFN